MRNLANFERTSPALLSILSQKKTPHPFYVYSTLRVSFLAVVMYKPISSMLAGPLLQASDVEKNQASSTSSPPLPAKRL